MDAAALWQRYLDWLYYHEELGIFLDVSRMRFDDAFVATMQPKLDQAFQEMAALEAGAIANSDENRMVGHYWLRDWDLAPTAALRQEILTALEQVETFVRDVHSGVIRPPVAPQFTDIVSIGIGGSALGPQFVSQALATGNAPLAIHFIDNTDPEGIDHTLDAIRDRLSSTLVLIISKSGGTPEPRNGMVEVEHAFSQQNLDFPRHAIAITGEGSRLDQLAKFQKWLATFPMQDWVGGRTSELSAVGLLPAALQGIDIRGLLSGAKIMDQATRTPNLRTNPAALLALSWYFSGNGQGQKDMVVLPYKDSLQLFSRYLQQLVMESLGKGTDREGNSVLQGIAVYGNKGSTDQHAYVQQLREGVPNFFITFVEVLEDRLKPSVDVEAGVTSGDYLSGLLQGTREAIYENTRDSITVTLPRVDAQSVGALIALYDRAVGLYASLINVNAYHQPGVEAGKKAAAAVLDLQREVMKVLADVRQPLTLAELADQVGAPERVEVIYKILRHLCANQRGVTLVEGDFGHPDRLKVAAV